MIKMEYPKADLEAYRDDLDKLKALKRQVDILTDNLQVVLNSIDKDITDKIGELALSRKGGTIEGDLNIIKGDLKVSGNKVVTGTGTYIGMNSDTTSLSSNTTWNDLNTLNGGNLSLGAGRWLLIGQAEFPAVTSGRCGIRWKNATAGTAQASSQVVVNRAGGVTQLQTIGFFAPTETRELCLQAFQSNTNSTALTVTARWFAIKLRD